MTDPRPAYAAADIVLGMGVSALRAMAFAKPVVVQGEHGFCELLTPQSAGLFSQHGWFGLGPPEHGRAQAAAKLTAILRDLADDRQRQINLGQFARTLVVERHSLDTAAKNPTGRVCAGAQDALRHLHRRTAGRGLRPGPGPEWRVTRRSGSGSAGAAPPRSTTSTPWPGYARWPCPSTPDETSHPDERSIMTEIPLVDLAAQHAVIADEVTQGWQEVLARTAFIGGRPVNTFEREFAAFTGCGRSRRGREWHRRDRTRAASGGIGPDDEVILPANSFIATAEAVWRTGATPVLVDCADDDTYLMDMAAAQAAVTPRTKAFIPVHLYGQLAPVEQLTQLAASIGALILEDAAQAQGATRYGRGAGSLGHAAATSFYPGKNLGAYGDAGAVLTNSPELADLIRLIREHGSPRKYVHESRRREQPDGHPAGRGPVRQAAPPGGLERGQAPGRGPDTPRSPN